MPTREGDPIVVQEASDKTGSGFLRYFLILLAVGVVIAFIIWAILANGQKIVLNGAVTPQIFTDTLEDVVLFNPPTDGSTGWQYADGVVTCIKSGKYKLSYDLTLTPADAGNFMGTAYVAVYQRPLESGRTLLMGTETSYEFTSFRQTHSFQVDEIVVQASEGMTLGLMVVTDAAPFTAKITSINHAWLKIAL